jgi:hypothetical protein
MIQLHYPTNCKCYRPRQHGGACVLAPSHKCKAGSSDDEQQPHHLQKVVQVSEEEPDNNNEGDTSDNIMELTEKASSDDENVKASYKATKVLGDADCKVSVCFI